MLFRRATPWVLTAVVVVSLAGVWACSKSSSPTSPSGGGGGTPELNSGDFGPSDSYQHRFQSAGTFPYHCIHHGAMTGSVVVTAAAADTAVGVSITSSTSPFPAASVKPGGIVVWTNNTAMVHTVTSN